ncbi:MAG: C40 family peptidase [Marinilabiliaceae bacterium]|nr:C40 family peptidase [Marinilabiliaceae bacterium]
MKFLFVSVIGCLVICYFTGCSRSVEPVINEIRIISKKWVPDQREGICDVHIDFKTKKKVIVTGETNLPGAKNEILEAIISKGFIPKDEINLLPDLTVGIKKWALVNLSVANMRSRPSHAAEMVSQAILGTPVKVLKREEDWALIQTPDRYIAWTNSSSLSFYDAKEITSWRQSNRIIYLGNTGVITEESGDVVADIITGSILQKEGESDQWVKVILPRGDVGYVDKEKVVNFNDWKQTVAPSAIALVTDGKSLMSIPYLWGGTSVKGLDCSGFVKSIYFQNGVVLARDASLQIRYGQQVDISEGYDLFQAGDLLFFGPSDPCRVTHVGMYIGNSEYIHEAGRVKVNSLDSTRTNYNRYRKATLLGARRYIGEPSQQGIRAIHDHPWY